MSRLDVVYLLAFAALATFCATKGMAATGLVTSASWWVVFAVCAFGMKGAMIRHHRAAE